MNPQAEAPHWFGQHVVHAPRGPIAALLDRLGESMYVVSGFVFVLVILALFGALLRRRSSEAPAPDPMRERRLGTVVAVATGTTVVILLVFLVLSYDTGRAITGTDRKPLEVRVIGHQWWWEIEYPDSMPQHQVTTANEIHIPVGIPVSIELRSNDVNHSLWIPNLAGKRDLIPGQTTRLWLQADSIGVYRGQCAEFCGHQHAKMALQVIAEPQETFERWLTRQRDSANTPTDSLARRGQAVFLGSTCVMCHAIQGTPAGSRMGPDLTHLASRHTIAAGTMSNIRGNLAAWILDPQVIKPGAHMPSNHLSPQDLAALMAYLETLR